MGSLAIGIGRLALGAAALTGFVLAGNGPPLPSKEQLCYHGAIDPEAPPMGGGAVLMSVAEAERAFNPPLVRPQIDVASDDSIAQLWVHPDRFGQVYIEYDSGIVVEIGTWRQRTQDAARALVAQGSSGRLFTIGETYVFSVPPQRPCFGGNAIFNIGGAHVAVINDPSGPFEQVRRVAESIIGTAPAVIAGNRSLDGT